MSIQNGRNSNNEARSRSEAYGRAARLAATSVERLNFWTIYGHYDQREIGSGDRIAVALHGLTDLDREEYNLIQKRLGEYQRQRKKSGVDGRVASGRRYETVYYSPLEERPGLFLEFSRLVEREDGISPEQWLKWIKTNGVLGKSLTVRGDRTRDVYSVFVEEAKLASRMRRLFEAAVRKRKPDMATLAEFLPEDRYAEVRNDIKRAEKAALEVVADTIEEKVKHECFRRVVRRDDYRQSRGSPLIRRWDFHSLLGAMWLQFMWLTTDDKTRYCEHCGGPLSPDRRSDAQYCGKLEGMSKACKQAAKRLRERKNYDDR